MKISGCLRKMRVSHGADDAVDYTLELCKPGSKTDEVAATLPMNALLGREIRLRPSGKIFCVNCGKGTKKSFSDGYCWRCFSTLAETDMCVMKPHTCHFDKGTCRDPDWGLKHCFQEHALYLARSSGIKVGITRGTQVPTRFIDQGASEALIIGLFPSRKEVGEAEFAISQEMSDKTNWKRMLVNELCDTPFEDCLIQARALLTSAQQEHLLPCGRLLRFAYPHLSWPSKISNSFNFDKSPLIHSPLIGIRGQYLIFEDGVLNIRSQSGYEVEIEVE
ncbi:MAG: hypothetical protein RL095_2637 [Verrucomicrobiota bacterium]|jgi:hypothetical protein